MISKIERLIRPVVIAPPDTIREAAAIASLAEEQNYKLGIDVSMRNGDSLHPETVDEVFEIPNKKSNPIQRIQFESGRYTTKYVSISIGGSWDDSHGAKLRAHGCPEFTTTCADRFQNAFDKERPLKDWIPSANPLIIILVLTATSLYTFWGTGLIEVDSNKNILEAMGGAFALGGLASATLFLPITVLQSRIFGRAAFFWSDGATRYEKSRMITNYLFWIIPITIALNSLSIS